MFSLTFTLRNIRLKCLSHRGDSVVLLKCCISLLQPVHVTCSSSFYLNDPHSLNQTNSSPPEDVVSKCPSCGPAVCIYVVENVYLTVPPVFQLFLNTQVVFESESDGLFCLRVRCFTFKFLTRGPEVESSVRGLK